MDNILKKNLFKVGYVWKFFSVFGLVSFMNFLLAAEQCLLEEKEDAQMLSVADSALLSDGRIALLREEQVKKVNSIVDSLISASTTQFLADCVPVGGTGQPTDRSPDAFKIAAGNVIRARYFPGPSNI